MTNNIETYKYKCISDIIVIENQDYVEDEFIALCDKMEKSGIHSIEIASGLIFTLHYLLCRHDNKEAEKYYSFLLNQCLHQVETMHEFYDVANTR